MNAPRGISSNQISNGASAAMQKLQNAAERAKVCYPSEYSLMLVLPKAGSISDTFSIDSKGDFLAEYVTGKMYAIDDNGAIISTVKTGITFNINDSGNNRDFFLSPAPAENLLTPGYGDAIYERWALRDYQIKSTSTVKISAANTNATYRQVLEISFIGQQFFGSIAGK